jgi:hypothetical protein
MLKVYLISVAISIIVGLICSSALEDKLKREGYTIIKQKSSFAEKLKILLYFFVPIVNIFLIIFFLFGEEYIIDKLKELNFIKKENKNRGE